MTHKFDADISSVAELLEAIQASAIHEQPHSHIRFWFRGQSDASWALLPGVYRKSFNAEDEEARLAKERHLSQDFTAMSAGLLTGARSEAELYFMQQHYRMPTRLLDWTTSPLAALYFAVRDQSTVDAAVFALDAYALGPDQMAKRLDGSNFKGIASGHDSLFKEALHPIFRWHDMKFFPNFILPVRPDQFDRRISLQRGCFTFHPPELGTLTKKVSPSLKVFRVPAEAVNNLRNELAFLAVDEFSIFGDLDHLAGYLRYAHDC